MSLWSRWWSRRGAAVRDRTGSHPFDEATGMDTAGLSGSYYATAPSLFRAVLERWAGDPATYAFIDLGCGKGRVVLMASELGFRECIGVELDPALADVAKHNVVRWRRAVSAVQIVCSDAITFDFPPGPCLVYLFNPFPGEMMERLLRHIAVAFVDRPGELDLLYVNAEFGSVLDAHPGFELQWRMPVVMSAEDTAADILYLSDETGQNAYEGDACGCWRWIGLR